MTVIFKRLFFFVVPLLFVGILGASYVYPGTLILNWEGMRYETSFFFALCVLLAFCFASISIIRVLRFLAYIPTHVKAVWIDRQTQQGLSALGEFIAERFEPGTHQDSSLPSNIYKAPLLRDVGAYFLDKTIPDTSKGAAHPLHCRVLCEKALRRGHWPQVLSLVEETRQFTSTPGWALWAGLTALINQQHWQKALTFAGKSTWSLAFSAAQLEAIRGAIHLEKSLQNKGASMDDRLEKTCKYVSLFWPLVRYVCEHSLHLSEKNKLRLLAQSWRAGPHLSIVRGALGVIKPGTSIDEVSKTFQPWWEDLREEETTTGLVGEGIVLAHGKVWGQAEDRVKQSLNQHPSREAYLLLAHIQREGLARDDLAFESLHRASEAPCLPGTNFLPQTLEPIHGLLPGVYAYMAERMALSTHGF